MATDGVGLRAFSRIYGNSAAHTGADFKQQRVNVVVQQLDTITSRQAGLVVKAGELVLVVAQGAKKVGPVADVVARLVACRRAFGVEIAAVLGDHRRYPHTDAPAIDLSLYRLS